METIATEPGPMARNEEFTVYWLLTAQYIRHKVNNTKL